MTLDAFQETRASSVASIRTLWNNRLRCCEEPLKDYANTITPSKRSMTLDLALSSSRSAEGLTTTPDSRCQTSLAHQIGSTTEAAYRDCTAVSAAASPSTLRRRSFSHKAERAGSQSRYIDTRRKRRDASPPLTKPLFCNYLLQELESNELAPTLTLVLDLDETLVSNRSVRLPLAIMRPYCLHVLNALRHMCDLEIVLWTASTKETALPVVQQLHSNGIIFDEIIFRNSLWFTEPIHTKNLRLLGRNLDRVVIVDNAANCCKLNPHNAILIDDFHGCRDIDDAALVNVYYAVEALLKMVKQGIPVKTGLTRLATEGLLCRDIELQIPELWKNLPLTEIDPLKIPPYGKFVKANTLPPSQSIMKYWTF